ncbi:MAG TPA: hypothetical protein VM689_22815 [Aliidongia sp.]|nr:hypothetical protein [Aliidongia sp.]
MFSGWQSFYQVTGSAAGELIGLLFIVATLSSGREHSSIMQGIKLYVTPTVMHLALILVISGIALVPETSVVVPAPLVGFVAIGGLVFTFLIAVRLGRLTSPAHWSDFWCYGVAPTVIYAGLAGAAAAGYAGARAQLPIAVLLLILLLVAIRNAWDLVTWLAPRRSLGTMPPAIGAEPQQTPVQDD